MGHQGQVAGRASCVALAAITTLSLVGCGFGGVPINGTTPVAGTSNNWEFATTATTKGRSGNALTDLSGSILEETGGSAPHRTTAVFQATSGCYADAEVVPFDGSISGSTFQVRSFGVRGQFLTLNGTLDATASKMTGTYQIGGGCSNGEAGSLAGTRYSTLTGTFAGTLTSGGTSHQVSLVLTQSPDPTGQGTFLVAGTGTLSNFSCFSSGSVPVQGGSISGSKVSLVLNTDGGSGAVISLPATIDPAASTVTVSALTITGSTCAGSYGPVTLQRQ